MDIEICSCCGKPERPKEDAWEGHRYGGQILRDVCTPLVCAQKPWGKNRLDDIVRYGSGSLWIEGGRVGIAAEDKKGEGGVVPGGQAENTTRNAYGKYNERAPADQSTGRWPPNFCIMHHPSCTRVIVPAPCPSCSGAEGCTECSGSGEVGRGATQQVKSNPRWRQGTSVFGIGNIDGQEFGKHYGDANGQEQVPRYRCARHCPECGGEVCDVCGGTGTVEVGATNEVPWTGGTHKGGWQDAMVGGKVAYDEGQGVEESNTGGTEPMARYACARCCGTGCGAWWLAEEPTPCPECGGAGEWACSVRRLGMDSGQREVSGTARVGKTNKAGRAIFGSCEAGHESKMPNDRGTAARYYMNPDFSHETSERLALGAVRKYAAKPSKREKSSGLERLVWRKRKGGHDRVWSGAAIDQFWHWQQERKGLPGENFDEWLAATGGKKRKIGRIPYTWGNIHSTVKNLSLLIWLSRLLLPPAIYAPRRILVPFSGSGSECIAAAMAGWEEIVGIEQSEKYCEIARARLEWWSGWSERTGATEPKVILKAARKAEKRAAKAEAEDNGQLVLDLPSP